LPWSYSVERRKLARQMMRVFRDRSICLNTPRDALAKPLKSLCIVQKTQFEGDWYTLQVPETITVCLMSTFLV
jgi:hypothetical protein